MPRNRLLAALPQADLERLAPHLERVYLERGTVIYDPHVPIEQVCFPEGALISIVSVMSDGTAIETATIGVEGMVGHAIFHGAPMATEQAFTQIPGEAVLMKADAFRAALAESEALRRLMHLHALAIFTLVAQTSGCNRRHSVEERLARWLLTVHDRIESDRLNLTQQFLSQMLGVRRATVTVAAGALQRAGLIKYTRGKITVLDRAGLERASCECYRIIRSAYDRLLGGAESPSPLDEIATSEGGVSIMGDGAPRTAALVDAGDSEAV